MGQAVCQIPAFCVDSCVILCLHLNAELLSEVTEQLQPRAVGKELQISWPQHSYLINVNSSFRLEKYCIVIGPVKTSRERKSQDKVVPVQQSATTSSIILWIFTVSLRLLWISPAKHDGSSQLVPQDNPLSAAHNMWSLCASACMCACICVCMFGLLAEDDQRGHQHRNTALRNKFKTKN